jgi:hypothetical protein
VCFFLFNPRKTKSSTADRFTADLENRSINEVFGAQRRRDAKNLPPKPKNPLLSGFRKSFN